MFSYAVEGTTLTPKAGGILGVVLGVAIFVFGLVVVLDLFGTTLNRKLLWGDRPPPMSELMLWERVTGAGFMGFGLLLLIPNIITLATLPD
jgi:hypothetical protein